MAQKPTSSDAAQVSHDELYDAIRTLSRYRLNKILKNICEGNSRNHETLQKWLFVSEDKVAMPEIPPRPENAWPAMDDDSDDGSSIYFPSDDETSNIDHDDQSADGDLTRATQKTEISLQEDREEKLTKTSNDEQTSGDGKVKLNPEEGSGNHKDTHGKNADDDEAWETDDDENISSHGKSHVKAISSKGKLESDKNAKVKSSVQANSSKKLRARHSVCTNCNMEFDICNNTWKSCFFHIGDLIKRPNMGNNPWDDEDDFSDEPDPVKAFNDPYSHYYDCCNGLGDHRGCAMDWHREKKYYYSKRPQKQKIYGFQLE